MLLTIAVAAGVVPPIAEAENTVLGLNAEGWVYVSLTIFIVGLVWFGRAHHRVRDALDAKIAQTRRQLDEAAEIRRDAEALLAEAKRRHSASAGDAEAIVAYAEQEAHALLAKAEADTANLIVRRGKMAEEKIAAAERSAVAEVRARAADAASQAAGTLIAAHHDAAADRSLIDRSIAGLSRPN